MAEPDFWTIHYLYSHYAERMKILDRRQKSNMLSYSDYLTMKHKVEIVYTQAMRIIFEREEHSDCLFLPIAEFAEAWDNGFYNECDGFGYFVDWDGNELGVIDWDNLPEEACFVAWYNN